MLAGFREIVGGGRFSSIPILECPAFKKFFFERMATLRQYSLGQIKPI